MIIPLQEFGDKDEVPESQCVLCNQLMEKRTYSVNGRLFVWFWFCINRSCQRFGLCAIAGNIPQGN